MLRKRGRLRHWAVIRWNNIGSGLPRAPQSLHSQANDAVVHVAQATQFRMSNVPPLQSLRTRSGPPRRFNARAQPLIITARPALGTVPVVPRRVA